jgi:hypothetical protein
MSTPAIIRKLTKELDAGITTEVQVVYLLAGVRKLIERDQVEDHYPDLKFHCDWALHSVMSYSGARVILGRFDVAHPLLKGGTGLPSDLKAEIDRISKMKSFHKQLDAFLEDQGLPPLTKNRPDGWAHFLHLYARVIEDIPLTVVVPTPKPTKKAGAPYTAPKNISHITVHFQQAKETIKRPNGEEVVFTVTWVIHDKNGGSGAIPVYNSFSRTA